MKKFLLLIAIALMTITASFAQQDDGSRQQRDRANHDRQRDAGYNNHNSYSSHHSRHYTHKKYRRPHRDNRYNG